MIRFIGIFFVISATTLLGFLKSGEYSQRVKYLKSMQNCIVRISNEIRYTQVPLKDVFFSCSCSDSPVISAIFNSAYNLLNEYSGKTFEQVWEQAVAKCEDGIFKDDVYLFLSLGSLLSNTDIDGQLKGLNLFEQNLSEAISAAETSCERNKKKF